jgi:tetratricopeptide (TPR) repeat protein
MSEAGIENTLFGTNPRRPDMLPPDVELIGREDELERLHQFLDQGTDVAERIRTPARVCITGEAGVGKSALATRFAYQLQDKYPDGALYVDVSATTSNDSVGAPQILRRFLVEFQQDFERLPQETSLLHDEFIEATDGKKLIVFLDNVQDYQSVKDLVPKSSTCLVIFTSLARLEERMLPLRLNRLSGDSAVELFTRVAPSRKPKDPEQSRHLKEVLEACDGLPIAVLVLAARLQDDPDRTLVSILQDLEHFKYQRRLAHLFGPGGDTIEACFRVSYNALTSRQSRLLRRLSLVPGESFDPPLAAVLGELSAEEAQDTLERLLRLQFIQRTQDPEYFTMHSLWRIFLREQTSDSEAEEQLKRALTFYQEMAEEKDSLIRSLQPRSVAGLSARASALGWMAKQHKNLVAAVERACIEGESDLAWRTCRALVEFFEIRGEWESWRQTHKAAESIVSKESLGAAYLNYGLGRLNGSRRHWREAIRHYRIAIAIFRQMDAQIELGRCLNSLGDAYRYMRNWDAAENCFQRSLEILESAHHQRQVAIAKRSMSTIHRQRGEFPEADRLCREAIDILEAEEQRDERWIAATKLSLADIYLDSGSRDARGLLLQCLEVFKALEDTHWLILTRRSLSEALREEEDYDGAMRQLEVCQELLRRSHDDHWEGQVLHSMGLVYLDRGDTVQAMALFDEALEKFRKSQDTLWEGRTQISIGLTALAGHSADMARSAYHAAWVLLVEQGATADLERLRRLEKRLGSAPDADGASGPHPDTA